MKYSIILLIALLVAACKHHILQQCNNFKSKHNLRELQINESDTTVVCAINPRNRTGILLKKDQAYSFQVIPSTQRWKDSWLYPFNANGRLSPHFTIVHFWKRKVGAKWFSLIGSIEDKHPTYFKIGKSKKSHSPKQDGELVCFANDVRGDKWYNNNKGALTLVIKRIK